MVNGLLYFQLTVLFYQSTYLKYAKLYSVFCEGFMAKLTTLKYSLDIILINVIMTKYL